MKMMQKSLLALAVMATTALNVQAASNVDVKVIGRIDPGSCTPTLSGGGTVDYGTMSPSSLNASGYTVLSEKTLDLEISCTAPSKVAIKAVNGRPNTLAGATEAGGTGFGVSPTTLSGAGAPLGASNAGVAGLGLAGAAKVGGYTIALGELNADATLAAVIGGTGSTWTATTNAKGYNLFRPAGTAPSLVSPATAGTTTPVAFSNLTGKLTVQAYLNQRSAFDLTNTVQLDGLSTLELVYLP